MLLLAALIPKGVEDEGGGKEGEEEKEARRLGFILRLAAPMPPLIVGDR